MLECSLQTAAPDRPGRPGITLLLHHARLRMYIHAISTIYFTACVEHKLHRLDLFWFVLPRAIQYRTKVDNGPGPVGSERELEQ